MLAALIIRERDPARRSKLRLDQKRTDDIIAGMSPLNDYLGRFAAPSGSA